MDDGSVLIRNRRFLKPKGSEVDDEVQSPKLLPPPEQFLDLRVPNTLELSDLAESPEKSFSEERESDDSRIPALSKKLRRSKRIQQQSL
jgi:hypothetical protein